MKVSLVQFDVKDGQPQTNKNKVLELMQRALSDQPDVIILPELWNTGYALEQLEEIADENGEDSISWLSQFAREHQVALVAGSVATKRQGKFYNTGYTFAADGKLINASCSWRC